MKISEQHQDRKQNSRDAQVHFLGGRRYVHFFCPIQGWGALARTALMGPQRHRSQVANSAWPLRPHHTAESFYLKFALSRETEIPGMALPSVML